MACPVRTDAGTDGLVVGKQKDKDTTPDMNQKRKVYGLEALVILAVVVAVLVAVVRALITPDTMLIAGQLEARCADFPASTVVTIERQDGVVIGQGTSTPPHRSGSSTCWTGYSVNNVEQSDGIRIVIGGELRTPLVSSPPPPVVVASR